MRRSIRYIDNQGRPTIEVRGLPSAPLRDLYHRVLTMRWRDYLLVVASIYVVIHAVFALLYLAQPGSILNARPGSFADAYFFSVQTMMTIGYGVMSPGSTYGHVLVAIEAFLGMLGTALVTGIVFAKFATPRANVLFSDVCCIARHEGKPTLLFRMANQRGNRLVQAALTVVLAKSSTTSEGERFRKVYDLPLVRSSNPLFWIGWTAMHVIDEASPFHGETKETLLEKGAELIVVLAGVDEHSSMTVHARRSYSPNEMRWGARFVDILSPGTLNGRVTEVDYTRFHETQPAEL